MLLGVRNKIQGAHAFGWNERAGQNKQKPLTVICDQADEGHESPKLGRGSVSRGAVTLTEVGGRSKRLLGGDKQA